FSKAAAYASISGRVRFSVTATSRPPPYSSPSGTPARKPSSAIRSTTTSPATGVRTPNSRSVGAAATGSTPSMPSNASRAYRVPPGRGRDVSEPAGEQAQVGPAEAERRAERLPLADDDVGAVLPRRAHQAGRHRVEGDQQERAGAIGHRARAGEVLEAAEVVG